MKKSKPQNNQQQKSSSSPAKKVRTRPQSRQANQTHNQQSRAGLRPRTAPGKAKTTFARAKAPLAPKKKATGSAPLKNKSVSQKLAIKRLNKARETLQKAVRAVNDANKNLAKQMPAQKQQQQQQKKRYAFLSSTISFYLHLVCRQNNRNKTLMPFRNKRRSRRLNANRTMARFRSRTVARFKSGAMCAVAMSPLKLAIAGHLGKFGYEFITKNREDFLILAII